MKFYRKLAAWLILPLFLSLFFGCDVGPSDSSNPDAPASDGADINPAPFGNNMGNICTGGSFATDGEWLYYEYKSPEQEYQALWRSRLDGTQARMLDTATPSWINVVDGWLYFIFSAEHAFYRMRTDGTEKQKIETEDICPYSCMIAVGDTLYFIDESLNIGCYKTDGTQSRIVLEGHQFAAMCVSDGWIYYIDYNPEKEAYTTYGRARLDGSDQQTLLEGPNGACYALQEKDGWVYFISADDNNAVYKFRAEDGSQLTRVGAECCAEMNIQGDWLYWIQCGNDSDQSLHRMRLDGTGIQNYGIGKCYRLCIFGDWIYLFNKSYPGVPVRIRLDGSEKQSLM